MDERPYPVVGTQLPQCRVCRPQRTQHCTAPGYQLQEYIDLPLFEMTLLEVDEKVSGIYCQVLDDPIIFGEICKNHSKRFNDALVSTTHKGRKSSRR